MKNIIFSRRNLDFKIVNLEVILQILTFGRRWLHINYTRSSRARHGGPVGVGGGSWGDRSTIARRSGHTSRSLIARVFLPLASPCLLQRVSVRLGAARSHRGRGKFTQPDRKKLV